MRPELLAAPFSFGIESVDGIGVVLDKVEEDIQMSSHDVFLLASESETFAPWLSLGPDESETFICEGTGLRDVKELALSGKVMDDSNHGVGFAVRAEEQWPCMLFHKRRGVPEWPSQLWRPVTGASEHDTDKRNDGLSTPGHSIPGASGQNTGGSNDLPTAIFSAETPTSSASADCMRVEITTVVPTPTLINAPVTAVATTQKVNRKKAKQSAVMKKSPLKMKQRQQPARGPITKEPVKGQQPPHPAALTADNRTKAPPCSTTTLHNVGTCVIIAMAQQGEHAGAAGSVSKVPVHPSTWYEVTLTQTGQVLKLRSSSFRVADGDSPASLKKRPLEGCPTPLGRQSKQPRMRYTQQQGQGDTNNAGGGGVDATPAPTHHKKHKIGDEVVLTALKGSSHPVLGVVSGTPASGTWYRVVYLSNDTGRDRRETKVSLSNFVSLAVFQARQSGALTVTGHKRGHMN